MTNKDVFYAAINHYGANQQIDVAIEEMAELTQALIKTNRYATCKDYKRLRDNVIEEIADVEIMLAQLRIIYAISEKEINDRKAEKIKRLKKRIWTEGKNEKTDNT